MVAAVINFSLQRLNGQNGEFRLVQLGKADPLCRLLKRLLKCQHDLVDTIFIGERNKLINTLTRVGVKPLEFWHGISHAR